MAGLDRLPDLRHSPTDILHTLTARIFCEKDSEWAGAFWILLTAAPADVKKKPGILLSPLG